MTQPGLRGGTVRWPLGPILTAVGNPDRDEFAARAGVSSRQVDRYRILGLDDRAADRVCIALGLMPELVFDDWLAELPERIAASARWLGA